MGRVFGKRKMNKLMRIFIIILTVLTCALSFSLNTAVAGIEEHENYTNNTANDDSSVVEWLNENKEIKYLCIGIIIFVMIYVLFIAEALTTHGWHAFSLSRVSFKTRFIVFLIWIVSLIAFFENQEYFALAGSIVGVLILIVSASNSMS